MPRASSVPTRACRPGWSDITHRCASEHRGLEVKGLRTNTLITRTTWPSDYTALGRRVALPIRGSVAPWLCKDTVRRLKRLVVRPQADLRQLESVLVRDREIRRAFRESTSGSPAARQERLKCSSIPNYYNLHEREALVERPARARQKIRRDIRIFLNVRADCPDLLDGPGSHAASRPPPPRIARGTAGTPGGPPGK